MFIDEVKIFARAGHGGKGAVAFHREAYIQGRPQRREWRARRRRDPRSQSRSQQSHPAVLPAAIDRRERRVAWAGAWTDSPAWDLVIKVPCGNPRLAPGKSHSIHRLPRKPRRLRLTIPTTTPGRPAGLSVAGVRTSRHQERCRALEINLEKERAIHVARHALAWGETRMRDLTENGQRFVLCKGRTRWTRQPPISRHPSAGSHFAQPGEAGTEGDFTLRTAARRRRGHRGISQRRQIHPAFGHFQARPKIAAYPFI